MGHLCLSAPLCMAGANYAAKPDCQGSHALARSSSCCGALALDCPCGRVNFSVCESKLLAAGPGTIGGEGFSSLWVVQKLLSTHSAAQDLHFWVRLHRNSMLPSHPFVRELMLWEECLRCLSNLNTSLVIVFLLVGCCVEVNADVISYSSTINACQRGPPGPTRCASAGLQWVPALHLLVAMTQEQTLGCAGASV